MKRVTCDVCQADITTGVNQRDFYHVANRDLCEACYVRMSMLIQPVMRTKQPFNYEWYDRLVRDSIERAISKGKWERL